MQRLLLYTTVEEESNMSRSSHSTLYSEGQDAKTPPSQYCRGGVKGDPVVPIVDSRVNDGNPIVDSQRVNNRVPCTEPAGYPPEHNLSCESTTDSTIESRKQGSILIWMGHTRFESSNLVCTMQIKIKPCFTD